MPKGPPRRRRGRKRRSGKGRVGPSLPERRGTESRERTQENGLNSTEGACLGNNCAITSLYIFVNNILGADGDYRADGLTPELSPSVGDNLSPSVGDNLSPSFDDDHEDLYEDDFDQE
jgi:hypothetical protein